ncbi:MAG: hypothetical protein V3V16_12270 [Melioribacteraceae bacterium]
MKTLNFKPAKTKNDFRKNYKLHDLAEYHGKNLFSQWGIDFNEFGKDRRYEKVWEKGKDKPDILANYLGIEFLIDWKGKRKPGWWVNKRAVESYKGWSEKLNLKMVICYFVFNESNALQERSFALLNYHKYKELANKAWDKNDVVAFEKDLPKFTKLNLIKTLHQV